MFERDDWNDRHVNVAGQVLERDCLLRGQCGPDRLAKRVAVNLAGDAAESCIRRVGRLKGPVIEGRGRRRADIGEREASIWITASVDCPSTSTPWSRNTRRKAEPFPFETTIPSSDDFILRSHQPCFLQRGNKAEFLLPIAVAFQLLSRLNPERVVRTREVEPLLGRSDTLDRLGQAILG